MPAIVASRPNVYTGSRLDRAAHRRDDQPWIELARTSPGARWLAFWRGRHLLSGQNRATLLPAAAMRAQPNEDWPWAFLGIIDGEPLFAIDVGVVDHPLELLRDLPEDAGFHELRPVVGVLPPADAALLAHVRGLLHWRARHRFCGHCGGRLTPRSAGNAQYCGQCDSQHFPRTDPAVIMLVLRDDLALLARSQRFPTPTMFSTLAGFLEPGESLEEAVVREVLEEVGVRVGSVSYHSSQPWPFPASLMVGFHAETSDTRIVIDNDEISDARWFSRAELRDAAAHGFTIPGVDSIARRLIEDWLDVP